MRQVTQMWQIQTQKAHVSVSQAMFWDQFLRINSGTYGPLGLCPQRLRISFFGSANDGHVFQAQFPETHEEPAPKSQDFQARRNCVIFSEMQQSGSGRRMCDIRSHLRSIIDSAGFRGKEISLSQRTHALYFYKNIDKTCFFLISFQSLKKEKCSQCIFFFSEPQNVSAERGFGVECSKNGFLEYQLQRVIAPACTKK